MNDWVHVFFRAISVWYFGLSVGVCVCVRVCVGLLSVFAMHLQFLWVVRGGRGCCLCIYFVLLTKICDSVRSIFQFRCDFTLQMRFENGLFDFSVFVNCL